MACRQSVHIFPIQSPEASCQRLHTYATAPLPPHVILQYAALVDAVREAGGEALVFSSMHISGEQLAQLSGIAAILRFPLPDLEDMELNEEI